MVYFYVKSNLILFDIFPYLGFYIYIFIFKYIFMFIYIYIYIYISPWLIYLGRQCHINISIVTFFPQEVIFRCNLLFFRI